jgi:hypothetical protein
MSATLSDAIAFGDMPQELRRYAEVLGAALSLRNAKLEAGFELLSFEPKDEAIAECLVELLESFAASTVGSDNEMTAAEIAVVVLLKQGDANWMSSSIVATLASEFQTELLEALIGEVPVTAEDSAT